MKEIPVLFSTPMVQAILKGRKSQTRRVAAVPVHDHYGTDIMDWGLSRHPFQEDGQWKYRVQTKVDESEGYTLKDKYGKVGDLLWVRETWAPDLAGDGENGHVEYIKYAADGTRLPVSWVKNYDGYKNRPGIHMNKEYARIWLQVTDIRVERLQDITEEDAKAEGAERLKGAQWKDESTGEFRDYTYKDSFELLWQSINGPESWQANPWMWVISFKVLSTTGKPK